MAGRAPKLVFKNGNMKVLPPNREVLEDFARNYPDILVDMIKTESMYEDGWCKLAIEVVDEILVDSVSVPLLKDMTGHPSASIREVAYRLLAQRNLLEEIRSLALWNTPTRLIEN